MQRPCQLMLETLNQPILLWDPRAVCLLSGLASVKSVLEVTGWCGEHEAGTGPVVEVVEVLGGGAGGGGGSGGRGCGSFGGGFWWWRLWTPRGTTPDSEKAAAVTLIPVRDTKSRRASVRLPP
uniref:Uncharacterized protein n=1 Tax=Knipowitschia caucasica TaxID=637954 RepID=A0AAV2MI48_KNICA